MPLDDPFTIFGLFNVSELQHPVFFIDMGGNDSTEDPAPPAAAPSVAKPAVVAGQAPPVLMNPDACPQPPPPKGTLSGQPPPTNAT